MSYAANYIDLNRIPKNAVDLSYSQAMSCTRSSARGSPKEGLMMLDVLKKLCLIESQLRRRLVYISALATAPWNRPVITNPPTYKGIEGNLVDFAIQP